MAKFLHRQIIIWTSLIPPTDGRNGNLVLVNREAARMRPSVISAKTPNKYVWEQRRDFRGLSVSEMLGKKKTQL